MFERLKGPVLERASGTKLKGSIGAGQEWIIPHVVNVSGGRPEAEAVILQIIAQLAEQPRDLRESILQLSCVPLPTRTRWLQAGASCWREIEGEAVQKYLDSRKDDSRNRHSSNSDSSSRDPRNSIKSVDSQSFRDSGFPCRDQRPFSGGSANTRYSDARDSNPLRGPSGPLGKGTAHQSFGTRIIPLRTHSGSQGSTGKQRVNPMDNMPSSSISDPKEPLTEERKAKNKDKEFWCPESDCTTGCTRPTTLKNHMEDYHMTWCCSECVEEMSKPRSRQQMERHIKEKHEDVPDARLQVKGRLYFGCPSCTLCLDGFDEYVAHTTTAHSNPKTARLKRESTRLYSLLAYDKRVLDAIDSEAMREMLNWRSMLDNLSEGQRERFIKALEGGFPYFTPEDREQFVSDFSDCFRPAPVSGMDWSN